MNTLEGIDERAHKFFNICYAGSSSRPYIFNNSHEDLAPTSYLKCKVNICAHCGERSRHIQSMIPDSYDTTGYTCVCKGAMDEIDATAEVKALEDQIWAVIQTSKPSIDFINKTKKAITINRLKKALEEAESNDNGRVFFNSEADKEIKVILPEWMEILS